ncbi:MAG: 3-phosphoshikimate 1-carboxyvinyltransferase [Alphaproteobacteria bacterium]|nr:3-phosphoshikimate 1-carboxyvinyltransferase [Alphaproteobacteria bacterium]
MRNFVTIHPKEKMTGEFFVPGDKSISHRVLILAALTKVPLEIKNLNSGEDVARTRDALKFLTEPSRHPLDMGNSGTSARLLMGLLSTLPHSSTLTGDESLSRRPMKRVMDPLRQMGAKFLCPDGDHLPITIQGGATLTSIVYRQSVPSAQVKSAILLAGLFADGTTTVVEPIPTRDHTERLMAHLGMPITVSHNADGEYQASVQGKKGFAPVSASVSVSALEIPGDPSAAAFWIVAALLTKDSLITIKDICWNPYRRGFCEILQKMGAAITVIATTPRCGEDCVDLICKTSPLTAIEISADMSASLIDEYPILAVAAAFAKGQSIFHGLGELRHKESDRLDGIFRGLTACGIKAEIQSDSLIIHGQSFGESPDTPIQIFANNDHRIAMAFSIFALAHSRPVTIHQTDTVNTSFPDFFEQVAGI